MTLKCYFWCLWTKKEKNEQKEKAKAKDLHREEQGWGWLAPTPGEEEWGACCELCFLFLFQQLY